MQYPSIAAKIPEQQIIVRRMVVKRNRLRYLIPYLEIIGFISAAYLVGGIIEFFLN
ncbi:MAG: hypothetical protein ABFD08_06670 [Syntrophomonas sp.]